ncbi:hypothetical protein PCANC_09854 [Puccinia coronata f. sp. avenae]|uniref:Trehalose-phosphatase n=1 Tax=Puccinia coronata f. sp. avenae TaxID=200324 RepID=A0A2N5T3Z1_9BASI|nr:hypothetical protein PCANC_09854 [Puccinia coronata f. sp. avenae]
MNHDYTAFIKGVLKPVHEATSVDRTRAEHLLQLLGRQPKIVTLVNSARSLKGLDSYKGIVGVNLAAEHGTILLPAGEKQPIEFLIDRVGDIRSEIQVTASEYPGAKISYHDPKNSIAFKYPKTGQAVVEAGRVHEKILEKLRDSEFILATPHTGFSEVRHADVNKGNLVAKLLKIHEFDGGIALGDTDADEGMFIAMNQKNDPRFISVIVSNNPNQLTHAQYKVCSVDEVHNLLKHLANEDKSNPEMLW